MMTSFFFLFFEKLLSFQSIPVVSFFPSAQKKNESVQAV
jgi:hypothetical protein